LEFFLRFFIIVYLFFCVEIDVEDHKVHQWGMGVTFSEDFGQWVVKRVDKGSQLEERGVQKNWRIAKVDQIEGIETNKENIENFLTAGKPCTIVFEVVIVFFLFFVFFNLIFLFTK
jgi:hypothetical protein